MNRHLLEEKNFIFIIGSPRSGTTWLQAMIGAHPQVSTTVELTLFSQYTAPWIRRWEEEVSNIEEGRWHQGLPVLWSEEEFYGFLELFLERAYEKVLSLNPQATHILDKHPGYSAYVDHIHRLIPNARFIHMIRDGRDVVCSMIAAKQQIGFGKGTVEKAAWDWRSRLLKAREAAKFTDQYLEVRYEELLNDGVTILGHVFDFCSLPVVTKQIQGIVQDHRFKKMRAARFTPDESIQAPEGAYRKGQPGSWHGDLSPIQRYIFNQIAGDLLQDLGYSKAKWWAESRFQTITLPARYVISTLKKVLWGSATALLGPTQTEYVKTMRSKLRR